MSRIEIMEEFVMPQLSVTELLMKSLENAAKDLVTKCITECAFQHGFDASEEIKRLGVENLSLNRKQMVRKGKSVKSSGVNKKKKPTCVMPFIAERVDLDGCQGLTYNHGLFTQCLKKPAEGNRFCDKCLAEASLSASLVPICGTIQQRLSCGPYDFKDSKGRSPTLYAKVVKKLKMSEEQVSEISRIIDPIHFQELPKEKKARKAKEPGTKKSPGRPKKTAVSIETEQTNDMFKQLAAEAEVDADIELDVVDGIVYEVPAPAKTGKKSVLSEEEKEMKKALAEEERRIKKEEREAKLAQEKAEKEAKKAQEKAEKEAKKAQEKAEREQKLAREKAEKEAARLKEKAEKEAKKAEEKAAKSNKTSPASSRASSNEAAPAPVPEQPKKVRVVKEEINGKTYLWSQETNMLYDASTKEQVGFYDKENNTITPLPDDDDENEVDGEESDDQYEE
jgi:chemotaxis protein histidine kinase CheA